MTDAASMADGAGMTDGTASTHPVIPAPTSIVDIGGGLVVTSATAVVGDGDIVDLLVATFARHTGVELRPNGDGPTTIRLRTDADDLGDEGYRLRVTSDAVDLQASAGAGLVRGIQTLVQLADPDDDGSAARVPGVSVEDRPRYPWRGTMLDIARHFFGVDHITRVIDLAVLYKLNVVHLHLSDDQGWRLEIARRPELTEVGGGTQVGDGAGGYLTRADYEQIVAYAAARHVTVVPEIDVPGHTNAALVAYPDLAPPGTDVRPYRGMTVGFSSLDAHNEAAYALVDDVIAELADIQPGGYVHVGGDEAHSTSDDDYRTFLNRTFALVEKHGMRPVAWQEAVRADLPDGMLVQYWDSRVPAQAIDAVRRGARLIMSPARHVYLDMKYEAGFPLGQDWAGLVDVRDAYDWDPTDTVDDAAVHGIEAPLWTETITTLDDIERMLLPRLPAVAERAWSAATTRDWVDFRDRLAAHEVIWRRRGHAYHRSAQVWAAD